MNDFSDHLISQKVADAFNDLSGNKGNILYPMEHFPSSGNELPLISCIYSNLFQTKYFEKTNQKASLLFDKHDSIDHEIFKLLTDETNFKYLEGSIAKTDSSRNYRFSQAGSIKKWKNYQSIYLLYYYSIMLNNESHLLYSLFLFVHDLMRQHFGGFKKVVTKGDIDKYKKDENDEIHYKSATFNNDVDLECSCELINVVIKEKEDNSMHTNF
ncbi:hypothetical protein M9Y10_042986 [Tritrichomonas musculus]|uniref:Uncharacterized protein n=1 Tax=Tritrichomonas musculus TaxID=1915356 RepID=A0ABR2JYG4_9EUKA